MRRARDQPSALVGAGPSPMNARAPEMLHAPSAGRRRRFTRRRAYWGVLRVHYALPEPRAVMTSRRPSLPGILILALAVGVALAMALPVGLRQHVGDDFHVFWQAGRNFATGAPLYHDSLPGARPLKYPPFAAMVFVPLALFPLRVAGVVMSLLNLALWVAAVWLTCEILRRTGPPGRLRLALGLGFILSAQYFLDNFHHVQMNEVTFVLALIGI